MKSINSALIAVSSEFNFFENLLRLVKSAPFDKRDKQMNTESLELFEAFEVFGSVESVERESLEYKSVERESAEYTNQTARRSR